MKTRATANQLRDHLDGSVDEKGLQQAILDLAQLHGWLCYHTFDSRKSTKGFPDLVMVKEATHGSPWQLIFAELKSATGKVSAEQDIWMRALRLAGVETHVWRPADWPTIVTRLKSARPIGAR